MKSNSHASKAIPACLLLLALTGCSGSGPTIDEFTVTPNPITAPTQGQSTEFKIGVDAWGASPCLLTLLASEGEVTDQFEGRHFIDYIACDSFHTVYMNCKSSLSSADAQLRDIECATSRANSAQDFKITRPAGSKLVFRVDTDTKSGTKVIVAVPLPIILPGMKESSDSREITVDLQ